MNPKGLGEGASLLSSHLLQQAGAGPSVFTRCQIMWGSGPAGSQGTPTLRARLLGAQSWPLSMVGLGAS